MAGKDLIPMIVTGALAACSLISWIIFMAGVGAFQSWMDDTGTEEPGRIVSYYWWNLWFILPLIIGAVIAAVMKHPSVIVRPLTLLFAVALAEIMGLIDYTYKSREGSDWPDEADSRLGAVLAGGIMLAMATLAMTVWLAVLDARSSAPAATVSKEGAAPGHATGQPAAGGYVVNVPGQAPAGAGGYNYDTAGAVNYPPQNNAVYAPAAPGPDAVPIGAPAPMQPGAQPGQPGAPDPMQPGVQPGQPGAPAPMQPGVQPGQPGAPAPMQPGVQPGQPGAPALMQPGVQPGQPAVVQVPMAAYQAEAYGAGHASPNVAVSTDGAPLVAAQPPAAQH